jgi:hypothetical protein
VPATISSVFKSKFTLYLERRDEEARKRDAERADEARERDAERAKEERKRDAERAAEARKRDEEARKRNEEGNARWAQLEQLRERAEAREEETREFNREILLRNEKVYTAAIAEMEEGRKQIRANTQAVLSMLDRFNGPS